MGTEEENKIIQQIKQAIAESRGYADYFCWPPDRNLEEYGIVKLFCESLEKEGKSFLDCNNLMSRGRGNDPPDCEAKDFDGNLVGIEVTELVDPKTIVSFKKGQIYDWAKWDKDNLINAINTRLNAKNIPSRIQGGPYVSYILLIHTDEPFLNVNYANSLLKNYRFTKRHLIDRAFLLISYDPECKTYPCIELEFAT